jgi:hypothetical protein
MDIAQFEQPISGIIKLRKWVAKEQRRTGWKLRNEPAKSRAFGSLWSTGVSQTIYRHRCSA